MRLAATLALSLLLVAAPGATTESEWTDGSPPPLDFGLRVTGAPSTTAPYPWLRSTNGGTAVEGTWNETGVETEMLASVDGGVETGMTSALSTHRALAR